MAKKSKKKTDKKTDKKAKALEAARLKVAKKAKKAAAAETKQAKVDAKAAKVDAVQQAGEAAEKPDQVELLKLALRSTEAKLVDAEHRLRQVQQQLDDERRRLADASGAEELLEDAFVDAAVEATIAEVLIDTEADLIASGLVVSDAEIVELAAEQIDVIVVEPLPVPADVPAPSTGEAEAAAQVFDDAGLAVVPPASESELTPPMPSVPEPGEPNASWTLLKLREEARRRGLQSTSSLPKAALLSRLLQD